MDLQYLTARSGADPKRAGRVIVDTNVAAPALRWIALGSRRPPAEVVEAFVWMQRLAMSSRISSVDLRLDLAWAGHETSRNHGLVDGERVARIHAANVILLDWLWGVKPIARLFAGDPPPLRPSRQLRQQADGFADNPVVQAESAILVHLSRVHQLRRSGELSGPKRRLEALQEWSDAIAPLGAFTADVILIAIQTAFAGDGAPARAMCKFDHYRDRESARAAAANAAWDLQFLRLMRASEAGLGPYAGSKRATTLLTFDRQLGSAAEDLDYFQRIGGAAGDTVMTKASFRKHLQRDMLRDPNMLDQLNAWCMSMYELQVERWDKPRAIGSGDVGALLDGALDLRFPA